MKGIIYLIDFWILIFLSIFTFYIFSSQFHKEQGKRNNHLVFTSIFMRDSEVYEDNHLQSFVKEAFFKTYDRLLILISTFVLFYLSLCYLIYFQTIRYSSNGTFSIFLHFIIHLFLKVFYDILPKCEISQINYITKFKLSLNHLVKQWLFFNVLWFEIRLLMRNFMLKCLFLCVLIIFVS